jgi:hypothetical protein
MLAWKRSNEVTGMSRITTVDECWTSKDLGDLQL